MNKWSAVQPFNDHPGVEGVGGNCQQRAHMHWQGAQVCRYSSSTSRFTL